MPVDFLLKGLALGVALTLVFAAVLMWLWNITIPQLFGLRRVTYWQAFRLLVIAGLLFGGPGVSFSVNRHQWLGGP